jgi:hypothetical protein
LRSASRFQLFIFSVDFMSERRVVRQATASLIAVLLPLMLVRPATALSMKECSVKYKAAQDAGEAEGLSWSEFRKAQCAKSNDSTAAGESADPAPTDAKQAQTAEDKPEKVAKKTDTAPKSISGKTTFPTSVSSKFAAAKPAKARMHTCLEQYHANMDGGTLGGMRWIEKDGGHYKLCNAKLKRDS